MPTISKLISFLQELKSNFSEQSMNAALECLEEMHADDLHQKADKFREAFNGQPKQFYSKLAKDFVTDLNESPDLYFLVWEPWLDFMNPETKSLFYDLALGNAGDSNATDFINGLTELDNNRPEIALFHFNRIDDYVGAYFIALCYLYLENYENCINHNLLFLDGFEALLKGANQALDNEFDTLLVKYNVNNDLGYCYNRIGEYSKAHAHYEAVLAIFPLEDLYSFRHVGSEEQDLFALDLNNFLLAYEKTGRYSGAVEILDFAIAKYFSNNYYQELRQNFQEKITNLSFADEIIRRVFNTKKPFNIERFETTKLLAKEKILEDMIIEQIKYGFRVFGKDLEVYNDGKIFGRQYYLRTVNGILDLLLIEKSSGTLYVVELKRNEAGVEVVEQVERYMSGLKDLFPNRPINGIVCLHRPEPNLVALIKKKPNIEVFTYEFNFTKLG